MHVNHRRVTKFKIDLFRMIAKPHPELTHFDLSYNGFDDNDAKSLSSSLTFNQAIYGFHFAGNSSTY